MKELPNEVGHKDIKQKSIKKNAEKEVVMPNRDEKVLKNKDGKVNNIKNSAKKDSKKGSKKEEKKDVKNNLKKDIKNLTSNSLLDLSKVLTKEEEIGFARNLEVQLKAAGFGPSTKQLDQFTTYYKLLIETNKTLNLTAITDPHEVAVKHMVDSLTALSPVFKDQAKVLDLGTGAGFPGIPLAIWRPDLQITLFDSLQKRLKFLQTVITHLGLKSVTTLHGRAEDLAHQNDHREAYDIVTSRAVARLTILLEWSLPYVKVGGSVVALKGAIYEEEIDSSDLALQTLGGKIETVNTVTLPTLDDKRAVIYIKKVKNTPKKYPRKPKDIKAKPLEK